MVNKVIPKTVQIFVIRLRIYIPRNAIIHINIRISATKCQNDHVQYGLFT